jgi:hypothetical protein
MNRLLYGLGIGAGAFVLGVALYLILIGLVVLEDLVRHGL